METLSEILRRKDQDVVHSIDQNATVMEAVDLMNRHSVGALIVTRSGKMTGIFTERDILRRVLGEYRDPRALPLFEVMTRRVVCCAAATTIDEATSLMKDRRIRHLPILDSEGDVVGLISIGDLNAYQASLQQETIHHLNEYLYGRA
jgi:CBS domain-containing protein